MHLKYFNNILIILKYYIPPFMKKLKKLTVLDSNRYIKNMEIEYTKRAIFPE